MTAVSRLDLGHDDSASARKHFRHGLLADLVHSDNDAVRIFPNAGAVFPAEVSFSVAPISWVADVGDLTGDGVADLLVSGGERRVYPGSGGFAFSTPVTLPTDKTTLLIGDGDGDGRLDVIASGLFIRSLGGGQFELPVSNEFSGGGDVAADVDHDGRDDIVALAPGVLISHVTIHRSLPGGGNDGAIGTGMAKTGIPVGGDFNGDGLADYATPVLGGHEVYQGFGGTSFAPAAMLPTTGNVFAIADLNGDGATDLVSRDDSLGVFQPGLGFRTYLSPGGGGFGTTLSPLHPMWGSQYAVGDIDIDGDLDLIASVAPVVGGTAFATNDGLGGFSAMSAVTIVSPQTVGVALYDFNVDGIPDLATGVPNASMSGGLIAIHNGTGAPGFQSATLTSVVSKLPHRLTAVDINGDGQGEIVTHTQPLTFSPGLTVSAMSAAGINELFVTDLNPHPTALYVTDFDLDGLLDVSLNVSTNPYILRGKPGGGLGPLEFYGVWGMVPGDLDLDGYPDLIGPGAVVFNRGDPTFCDLGGGVPGSFGVPKLYGIGILSSGATFGVRMAGGLPGAPMILVVGNATASLPLLGGTLVPVPTLVLPVVMLDGVGEFKATTVLPGISAGSTLYSRHWLATRRRRSARRSRAR